MPTTKGYLQFILDQLSALEGVTPHAMMGEYLLTYKDKTVAYLCDDRFLVKPTPTALALLPAVPREKPYEGAKDMLLVENVDDRAFLTALLEAIHPDLPLPKRRK